MAVIPVGNAQANLRFSGNAAPRGAEITLGLDLDVVATPAAVAELVAANWVTNCLVLQSSNITLEEVYVKFGDNATGAAGVFTVASAGSLGTGTVPPQVALLVKKNTQFGGRKGRGRFYVPGLVETDVDENGVVQGPDVAAWQDAMDDFHTQLNTDDIPPLLLHNDATVPYLITSFTVDATTATQRRRLRG